MSRVWVLVSVLSLGILSACGGGGGGGGNTSSVGGQVTTPPAQGDFKKVFELYHFDVVSDSDTVLTDSVTEVNSGFNQGAFSIEWAGKVRQEGTGATYYNVGAWVSVDAELSRVDDVRLFETVCNTDYWDGKIQHCGGDEWVMSCIIEDKYHMVTCGSDAKGRTTSIPLPMSQVPQPLNVIFRFCDRHQEECIIETRPILVY